MMKLNNSLKYPFQDISPKYAETVVTSSKNGERSETASDHTMKGRVKTVERPCQKRPYQKKEREDSGVRERSHQKRPRPSPSVVPPHEQWNREQGSYSECGVCVKEMME